MSGNGPADDRAANVMKKAPSPCGVRAIATGKVVIFYSSIGYGHISAAQSIQDEIRRRSPATRVLLQEDGGVKMIRRAETPADYFATFDFGEYGPKLAEEAKIKM